jgi:hypothetical protein
VIPSAAFGPMERNDRHQSGAFHCKPSNSRHIVLRPDGTGMVSTINELDTTDERSLKSFET